MVVPPDEPAVLTNPLCDAIIANGSIASRTEVIELRNAAQADPKNPRLNIALARLLIKSGDFGQAEGQERLALSNGGDDAEVAPLLAQTMIEERKYAILVQTVTPGSRPPAAEAQVRAALAQAHLALDETVFVEPLINDAKRLDPGGLPVAIATAQLLLSRKDVAGAAAELARARKLAPDDLDVLQLGAHIALLEGDRASALADCDSILAQWPNDVTALVLRASLRIDGGDLDAARKDVDTLLCVAPLMMVGRYFDALLLAATGDLQSASERLMAIGDFRALPDGYYLEAILELRLGRADRAYDAAFNFMALRPDDLRGNRLMAVVALRRNKPDQAVEALRPVLQKQPYDFMADMLAARAYSLQEAYDKAFQYYDLASAGVSETVGDGGAIVPAADVLENGIALTLNSVGDFARSVLDENNLALVSLISDVKIGAISRADAAAEKLVAHKPADPVAEDWLGLIRVQQRRYDDAIKLFDDLIKARPKFLDPRRNRARAYEAAGQPEAAERAWQDVLDYAPDDGQAYVGLADLALKAGNVAKSAEWLEIAQRTVQDNSALGVTALNLYVSVKDWGHALPLSQALSSFFKTDPKVANVRAEILAATGHLDQAKDLYDHFLRISPDAAEAWAGKAQLLANAGDKTGAREALVKAAAVAPGDLDREQALVDFDDANKGPDDALTTARSFAQQDPTGSVLLSAAVLINHDRNKDAIAVLRAGYAQRPDSKVATLLARTMAASGDAQGAESAIQSWLADHPQDWQARLELAYLYDARHADDDAFAAYLAVATAAPRNAQVLNNLAWAAARKSDPRALDWAERAYYLTPSTQTADTYGWVLTLNGHADKAVPLLQQARNDAPNDPSIAFHLAAALDAAGQKDAARALLQSALKSPDQFEGRQEAERLLAKLQPG